MNIFSQLNDVFDRAHQVIERDNIPISKDFFMAHWGKLLLVVVLALNYMNLRYECEASLFRIAELKKELADARYTSIARWGELTGLNKPDVVRRKVETSHVHLIAPDEPPVVVKK